MPPNLARYLNKTVLVSIPALFDDGLCRPYTLVGAELTGLWLQSEELADRLLPDESAEFKNLAPVVFVPFSHIAGVLVATNVPAQPTTTKTENADRGTGAANSTEPMVKKSDEGQPRRGVKKQ
jgi:hypothetical protein